MPFAPGTLMMAHLFRILFATALLLGAAWIWRQSPSPLPRAVAESEAAPAPVFVADFAGIDVSPDARRLAEWIAASANHGGRAFLMIDKRSARIHAFDGRVRLAASSPVLLGAARGDDSAPGVGNKPLARLRPEERTTPAGRFLAERGRNATGEDVVWIDYDAAVSIHRVRTLNARERRLERLRTPSIDDKRISNGCVNVPVDFFERNVAPLFARDRAVVYVLPEVKALQQVFNLPGIGTRGTSTSTSTAAPSTVPLPS